MTSLSELIHSFKSLHRMKVISFRTNECVYKQLDNICIAVSYTHLTLPTN